LRKILGGYLLLLDSVAIFCLFTGEGFPKLSYRLGSFVVSMSQVVVKHFLKGNHIGKFGRIFQTDQE